MKEASEFLTGLDPPEAAISVITWAVIAWNLYDAVKGCLGIDMNKIEIKESDTEMELAV